jgi:hypothetical protein
VLVYVVTQGSYSDFGIDRVFLNEQKANAYVQRLSQLGLGDNNTEIHTYETSDDGDDIHLQNIMNMNNRHLYHVDVFKDYTNARYWEHMRVFDGPDINVVNQEKQLQFDGRESFYHSVIVEARGVEHARKIAQDLVAQFKANKAGVT